MRIKKRVYHIDFRCYYRGYPSPSSSSTTAAPHVLTLLGFVRSVPSDTSGDDRTTSGAREKWGKDGRWCEGRSDHHLVTGNCSESGEGDVISLGTFVMPVALTKFHVQARRREPQWLERHGSAVHCSLIATMGDNLFSHVYALAMLRRADSVPRMNDAVLEAEMGLLPPFDRSPAEGS
ncbi:hypothetical protein VNO77_23048 [Canavalia gladiata]|uniref:Uncharacterized protein n=1 Tax=Canavalia gladiata TaxID=3824 RepID=A0AAN9QB63_CANGL